ncbi:MAG: hypothetical protein AUK48_03155 [Oscillatoriales cyanobacterium CG2_30_44_21]|nr:MAG: hypothetical protein AUK48_03155 [Oscillatoriales cyanobacterium CG2_30_44_21]
MNASGALLSLLLDSGHDVACVRDVDYKMSDSEILTWAVKEKRIIIKIKEKGEPLPKRQKFQTVPILQSAQIKYRGKGLKPLVCSLT